MSNLEAAGISISIDPRLTQPVLQAWESVVRQAAGLKENEPLPTPPRGTYSRLAFDNRGMLSLPRPKGRLRPRRNQRAIARAHAFVEISRHLLGKKLMFAYIEEAKKAEAAAKAEGKEKPEVKTTITPEITAKCQKAAMRKAERILDHHESAQRRARRLRQQTSRRINAGLIPGNKIRVAHSAA